jgi:nucleoid-associated protein YgaU
MSLPHEETQDARPSAAPARAGKAPTSAIDDLRRIAAEAGLDPTTELWNEALELAQEGHYGQAQSRLHVLLGLAPGDGEAHLLLAKVLIAGQQWRRALASLDDATAAGVVVPDDLRNVVLRNLGAEETGTEPSIAREARENAELSKLRTEVKRLRSENAALQGRVGAAVQEARFWSYGTSGFAGLVFLFVIWQIFSAPAAAPAVVAADAAATPGAAAVPAVAATGAESPAQTSADPASPRNGSLAEQAGQALLAAGILEGAELKVSVRGTSAQLSGTATNFTQLKKAAEVVSKVAGITAVGKEGVVVLSKRDGTTHVVASGDVLSSIAARYYGASSKSDLIVQANPQLGPKGTLQVGMSLQIPPLKD